MPTLLLTVALAAASSGTTVVVVRQTATSPERAALLAQLVGSALNKGTVELAMGPEDAVARLQELRHPPSTSCNADRSCAAKLARALDVPLLVTLDVGTAQDEVAAVLEAIDTSGRLIAQHAFIIPASKLNVDLTGELSAFSVSLRAALPAPTPPLQQEPGVALVPATAAPDPEPAAPSAVSSSSEVRGPSRVPAYLTGAGAVVAAGGSVAFLVMGLGQAGQLTADDRNVVPLSRPAAEATASRANLDFTVAASGALLTAALTAGTLYLLTASSGE